MNRKRSAPKSRARPGMFLSQRIRATSNCRRQGGFFITMTRLAMANWLTGIARNVTFILTRKALPSTPIARHGLRIENMKCPK